MGQFGGHFDEFGTRGVVGEEEGEEGEVGEVVGRILTIPMIFGLFPSQFGPFLLISGESERKRYGPTVGRADRPTNQ